MMDDCQNPKNRECHHMMRIKRASRTCKDEAHYLFMCDRCGHVANWTIENKPKVSITDALSNFYRLLLKRPDR